MVDLRNAAVMLDAQVVDDDAVLARTAVEVDVVSGFTLALDAGAEELQLALEVLLRCGGNAGGGELGFQLGELWCLGVGFFEDHGRGWIKP